MKNLIALALVFLMLASCKEKTKSTVGENDDKVLIEKDSKMKGNQDWTILFDGSSFDDWHYYRAGEVVEPWKIEDGAMVFYPPKEGERNGKTFNIVTDKAYTNFVLSVEWKISEGGNSGIFWGILEDEKYGQPYETGPEIQVLDDERHPDSKNGPTRQAGALYDMVPPSVKSVNVAGKWNTCVLTVNHKTNNGNVVLNGKEIAKFPVNGPLWEEMVANSKFADWEGFGKYKTGKIGLQDHNDIVSYRNIKIKEL
ncbi:DUF1080 domain-containing protein [Croceitalea sp. MTPC9]|uniref:3-keto-disaccharide hydrolase n=1 Tax=unclassified Croceitalea TaxID=2632280 RepID=UPI002B3B4380|nr:DUF1080 domain-containing protein [Croceitalea sp. MTPC6]GMN16411.1 DUF1080 domain-containing protein [Croceitalea sp. MTPC9]